MARYSHSRKYVQACGRVSPFSSSLPPSLPSHLRYTWPTFLFAASESGLERCDSSFPPSLPPSQPALTTLPPSLPPTLDIWPTFFFAASESAPEQRDGVARDCLARLLSLPQDLEYISSLSHPYPSLPPSLRPGWEVEEEEGGREEV